MKPSLRITEARGGGRRGLTLAECLVFSALTFTLMLAVYRFLRRSVALTANASHGIELQVGVRNLLENMVRDINGSHVFLKAEAGHVAVAKYRHRDARECLKINKDPGYPFNRQGGVTVQLVPVTVVAFQHDSGAGVVTRKAFDAILRLETEPGKADLVRGRLVDRGPETVKVLARRVTGFALRYFGNALDTGQIVSFEEGSALRVLGSKAPIRNLSMVLVRLKAACEWGAKLYRGQQVEILTKIRSHKLGRDARYRSYFSSMDNDTRF